VPVCAYTPEAIANEPTIATLARAAARPPFFHFVQFMFMFLLLLSI
jgi:hypothetical protein